MLCDLLPEFSRNLAAISVTGEERVLIAVSGGPDSMALLHLFFRWDSSRIGIFHLNHGFRKTASKDAQFVADYAKQLGIPAEIANYDVNDYLRASGESKQQGARKIRYQLLQAHAEEQGYNRIALAHHGDDQAETVLMRLLRGTGLHGLGGIPLERGPFIRPLLTVYKEDILQYCHDFAIPHVEDETNWQPIYLRNKIRQELLPLLARKYNPKIRDQLVQIAELAQEDELELQGRADHICEEHILWQNGQLLFPRAAFSGLSVSMQRRVLRALIRIYQGHLLRIGFTHIESWRLQLLENTTFRLSLPQLWVSASVDYIFVGDFVGEKWSSQVLSVPGQVKLGQNTITAEILDRQKSPRPKNSEDFDLGALTLPLVVRPRQAGDRMHPFGGSGSAKVKDLLIDAHIPVQQRDYLPLICDQQGILWIPAVRRSSLGAVHDQTGQILRLTFKTSDS